METFADRLKHRMKDRGWEAIHLAAAMATDGASVKVQTVERWISGDFEPRSEMLPFIARALNCTPNDLLGFGEVA